MFTFYFILAISVIVAISRIGQAFQAGYHKACETQRRIELHDARLAESRAKTRLANAIAEMKAAEIVNKVTLQDIKIEREKLNAELDALKVRKEKNAQGLLTADFTPTDYTSDPTPAEFTPCTPIAPVVPVDFTPTNYA